MFSGGHGQLAADGFLFTVATGAGRAPARHRGAAARRDDQRLGLHAGGTPIRSP